MKIICTLAAVPPQCSTKAFVADEAKRAFCSSVRPSNISILIIGIALAFLAPDENIDTSAKRCTEGLKELQSADEMLVKPFADLGGAVRAVRLRRRLTLRALAGATDLSESFLSQFERGLTQCSVASLRRIAEALGVELAQLFDVEGAAKGRVLRAAARPAISFGHFAVKQLLTPIGPEHVEVFSVRFETDGSTGDNQYIHGDSDEFLLVQSGSVRLHLSNDVFRLDEGDSIVFRSSVPHRVVNSNEGPSTVLWVISPPSRASTNIVSDSKPDRANAI